MRKNLLVAALAAVTFPAFADVFPGTGFGSIPDCNPCTGGGNYGNPPLDVTFTVAGITSITDIGVRFTGTHTWIGDLRVVLIAPGGSPSHILFSQIGSATAAGFGDSSNLGGTYGFQNGSAANIHTLATAGACGDGCVIASSDSVTITPNPPNVNTPTDMTSVFAALTPAAINGTWTLRFIDGAQGDLGDVSAANLFINQTVPVELQSFSVD
jgi:subtilisin-like proprotein convertase family protein